MEHWKYLNGITNLENGGPNYRTTLMVCGVAGFALGVCVGYYICKRSVAQYQLVSENDQARASKGLT